MSAENKPHLSPSSAHSHIVAKAPGSARAARSRSSGAGAPQAAAVARRAAEEGGAPALLSLAAARGGAPGGMVMLAEVERLN